MIGKCELCLHENVELQLSHIVPKFVWSWLKKTSPGKIRGSREPNLRIQDGPKLFLLCEECEQKLSKWEKPFYENIFLPLHGSEPVTTPIHYESWALKFATSVSWRVLKFFEKEDPNSHLSPEQKLLEMEALETWRKFLLDTLENPNIFSQHLLPVDVIMNYKGSKISPFLNRYFLRSIHIDVIATENSASVYTKMCRVIIFGRIHEKHPKNWQGMQLRLRKGMISPRDYHLPPNIIEFWNQKADETREALNSISQRQQQMLDKEFIENIDVFVKSEAYRAYNFDLYHSGDEAFSNEKN